MGKIIRQICNLIGSLILVFCIIFCLVGCSDKEKKYDVSVKVKNSEGSTWIFVPKVDTMKCEIYYTGTEITFWVDSYNLPNHPDYKDIWFEVDKSPNLIYGSLGKINQKKYEAKPKSICEPGEYYYHVYTESPSDLWNCRTAYLYITVIEY